MRIIELKTQGELETGFAVLRELRTALRFDEFREILGASQAANHYSLIGAFDGDDCIAVMGFRILHDFVHGRHLYIDDLVVTAPYRSKGVGSKLLDYAERAAEEMGCKGLRLCAGIQNDRACRFYKRNQWEARSIAYKKSLHPSQ